MVITFFLKLYGGALASNLLTSVNKLCVAYLQWMGHTISLKEFVTARSVSRHRRKALSKLIKVSYKKKIIFDLILSSLLIIYNNVVSN